MMTSNTNLNFFFVFTVLIFTYGCGNTSQEKDIFKDCKYGQPTAIFSLDLPQVGGHSFELKGKEGVELVSFKNGLDVELIQSGCNKITQDFSFMLMGKREGDSAYWTNEAVKQFQYLGSLSENFGVLSFWGQAILERLNDFEMGQAVEVQPGFYAEINKVISSDHAIVTVKLFEQ